MEPLLFLAHRLPYPPNKGDKIRSFHFLKHLAQRYRIYLGTFIDDAADWRHLDAVKSLCAEVHVESISPLAQRIRSVAGLFSGEALTLPYFRSSRLQHWVGEITRREPIKRAFAFSSPMAQYVATMPHLRSVVDFVDMDSVKWNDYARTRRWPVSAVYQREAVRLLAYERKMAARVEAVVFVTENEADLFRKEAPESARHTVSIPNGVDADYFSPSAASVSPFSADERAVVFTGAMDYWPNVDAVQWFAREVLPGIVRQDPAVRFYIVGMNPDSAVRSLANDPAVTVTGRVEDVRPYLQHARVVVAPLRVARGIQNKVLEAMAMEKPTVVTTSAAAGLEARPGVDLEVADDAGPFAAKVLDVMDRARGCALGRSARARILQRFTWPASFDRLDELLECKNVPVNPAPPVRPAMLNYALPGK